MFGKPGKWISEFEASPVAHFFNPSAEEPEADLWEFKDSQDYRETLSQK